MITGMHILINAKDAETIQAFLRDKVGLSSYNAGGGFMIFEAPALELACHESDQASYDISFFCDDIEATVSELAERGVAFASPIRDETWGRFTEFALPDGRSVTLYERKYSKERPIGSA